jgi:glycosyltransferase involved in cell wall biosynthesis
MESRLERLARVLPSRGWRPLFALAWGNRFHDALSFDAALPEMETVLLDGRTGSREGRLLALRRVIRRTRPDVMDPGTLLDAWEVAQATKGDGVRILSGVSGVFPAWLAFLRQRRSVIDRAYGVSLLLARLLREVCGLPESRVDYVPSGVPKARHPRHAASRALRIGYVGRLHDDKRPLDIVRLCEGLSRRRVDFHATVVGSGPLNAELEAAVAPWRAAEQFRILPPMSSERLYEEVYPELDVCLLFSPNEGQPNSLLEAMMHGVVPVTADYRGRSLQGLIDHLESGLVFPVGDVERAADDLADLAGQPTVFKRLSGEARRRVESLHTLDRMGDAFAAMLDRTMDVAPQFAESSGESHPPSTRLGGWIGPPAAEFVRRVLHRRFRHQTAVEEWPDVFVDPQPELAAVENALATMWHERAP